MSSAPGASWNVADCSAVTFSVDRCPSIFIPFFDPGSQWLASSNPRALNSWWADAGANDVSHDYQTYTGAWENPDPFIGSPANPQGNGTPDQFDQLEWRLDRAYAAGFRRITLQLPAGVAFGMPWTEFFNNQQNNFYLGFNQSINQWWAMPSWKRDEFKKFNSRLKTWKTTHSDVTFAAYVGFGLSETACSLTTTPNPFTGTAPVVLDVPIKVCDSQGCEVEMNPRWVTPASGTNLARDFDPRNGNHVNYVLKALLPWTNASVLKIKTFWMDASAIDLPLSNPDPRNRKLYGFSELQSMPAFKNLGVKFGGEAIPLEPANWHNYNVCAIKHGPWMALGQYFAADDNRLLRWQFDAAASEVHYLPEDAGYDSMANLMVARSRGLVISLLNYDLPVIRRVQRLYSMGSIEVADINCDGEVNEEDLQAWDDVLASASSRPFTTVAYGDLSGDGVLVDAVDEAIFATAYAASYNNSGHYIVNYGVADCE